VYAICLADAKKWEMCELATYLNHRKGSLFDRARLPQWMCLVQRESSFNQSAIGGPNSNGSFDWVRRSLKKVS
jgi:hypothetical protein